MTSYCSNEKRKLVSLRQLVGACMIAKDTITSDLTPLV